ncbi:MAG: hypothetical protein JWN94_3036 [Betaproteobacteria bacterium]|nr:hypothetical protein [Betaproteobacteria bacterium]
MTTIARAVDAHAHVFGGPEFPFSPHTLYTPDPSQMGTAEKFRAVLAAHGRTHGLLVGAGPYEYDNTVMLKAIAESDGHFKGVGIVRATVSEAELAQLKAQGVVGVRMNLMGHGMRPLTEPGADTLLQHLKALDMYLQLHFQKDELIAAAPTLMKSGVKLMIDHFGRPDIKAGVKGKGYQTVLEFGKNGQGVVKLSGPFRSSVQGYPYTDTDPFIAAAVEAFTLDHCIWGSDWPFVRMPERMDYGPPATCLPRWLPDVKDRQKVLWDTPARLFGFK